MEESVRLIRQKVAQIAQHALPVEYKGRVVHQCCLLKEWCIRVCPSEIFSQGKLEIVAISKLQSVDKIEQLNKAGQLLFGENYVPEIIEKSEILKSSNIEWNFTGTLQSNKIRSLIENTHNLKTIQSIDSEKQLEKLCKFVKKPIDVYIQINSSGENAKGGVRVLGSTKNDDPAVYESSITAITGSCCYGDEKIDLGTLTLDETRKLMDIIFFTKNLDTLETPIRLVGLMTMGVQNNVSETIKCFARLVLIKQALERLYGLEKKLELSMGMTADYEHAIRLGASSLRLGTAFFGSRS